MDLSSVTPVDFRRAERAVRRALSRFQKREINLAVARDELTAARQRLADLLKLATAELEEHVTGIVYNGGPEDHGRTGTA